MEEKSGKGKILLVDDTPSTVGMVKTALESEGYEVFVATSGEKALRRAELVAPDLIVLDILMPGMDGYETCRQLKAQEKTRDIPVMFMSALTSKSDKVKGFDAGGVDYVTKPIETEELLSRVNTHLTIRRLQADLIDAKTGLEEKVLARTEELRKSSLRLQEEISERKKAGQALRESQERYRALTEVTSDWVWEVNADGVYTYASPKIRDLLGFEPEEVIGKTPFDLMPPDEAERVRSEFRAIVESQKPFQVLENVNLHKDGHPVFLETSGVPVFDSNGGLLGYRGIDRDITERKKAEDQIKASLKEKEVMLREIHHRVKNNLAVMSSLLHLQSKYASDDAHRRMFQDARARIRSMALAHERLYQSKNLARINAAEYVANLVDHLAVSSGATRMPISMTKEIEDVSFGLDTAIPLGMVLTELVSNCMKHAFPDDREGEIRVSLRSIGEKEFELVVADNGVGIPEDLDLENPQSLGLRLVDMFVDQLDGQIDIRRGKGTEVQIRFKGRSITRLGTAQLHIPHRFIRV